MASPYGHRPDLETALYRSYDRLASSLELDGCLELPDGNTPLLIHYQRVLKSCPRRSERFREDQTRSFVYRNDEFVSRSYSPELMRDADALPFVRPYFDPYRLFLHGVRTSLLRHCHFYNSSTGILSRKALSLTKSREKKSPCCAERLFCGDTEDALESPRTSRGIGTGNRHHSVSRFVV